MKMLPWLVLLLGLGALSGGRSQPTGNGPLVVPDSELPEHYSAAKLSMLRSRWHTETIMAAVRQWWTRTFPGVPLTAAFASGVTSMGPAERGGPPDYATGLWGVEWPRVLEYARDPSMTNALGHPVPTDPDAFARDIGAQALCGFQSYARHATMASVGWPGPLHSDRGETWGWRIAMAAYSSGDATMNRLGQAAADTLGPMPERQRWRGLAERVIAEANANRTSLGGVPLAGRWKAAHTIIRCEQRYQSGMALARSVAPAELSWYGDGWLPPEVTRELASIAGRRS